MPRSGSRKYWRYLFVVATLGASLSVLALLNALLRFDTGASYTASSVGLSSQYVLAGYLGMFFAIAILPIPDYVLVPVFGYLCLSGTFDPAATFLTCLAGAVLPIEYVAGRLAARPMLLKALPLVRKAEEDVKVADDWLAEHGKFSVFISTFIPFFYSLTSFAAGTLKMGAVAFLVDSAGRKEDEDFVGEEFPLYELQEWADEG